MRTRQSYVSLSPLLAGAFAMVSGVASAWAQPSELMVDPGGAPPEPVAPEPEVEAPADGTAPGENQYYGDYVDVDIDLNGDDDYQRPTHLGVVPPAHTVRSGDTLWDISAYYLRTPWEWPQIWALNPEIKDPHWIYPGNQIRLRSGAAVAASAGPAGPDTGDRTEGGVRPGGDTGRVYGLKQTAYIDIDDLKDAAKIIGSVDEKSLLSEGDFVYLGYESGKMPKVGETFAVYSEGRKVKRDKKVVGHYVELAGELRVTSAQEGKAVLAVLTESVEPVERGMRVGALQLNFENVKPTANEQRVDGEIVDLIGPDELIGAEAAVIIDRGQADGVKVGNRFLVIRRGDAYRPVMLPDANVGQDNEEYPARAIGEVIVLQVGEKVSMGVVTFSIHEFGVGDRVFMRKGQ